MALERREGGNLDSSVLEHLDAFREANPGRLPDQGLKRILLPNDLQHVSYIPSTTFSSGQRHGPWYT
jgi:hypothetical protein